MNALIKFECPNCHQPMEAEPEAEFTLINCPGCGTGFYPKPAKTVVTPARQYSPQEVAAAAALNRNMLDDLRTLYKRGPRAAHLVIRERAENFATAAALFFGFGLVLVLIGLVAMLGGGSFGCLLASAGCLATAFWLYLIAQLLHIRAALESRPPARE